MYMYKLIKLNAMENTYGSRLTFIVVGGSRILFKINYNN